jgi:uncharacterized protein (TIGR02246 family)
MKIGWLLTLAGLVIIFAASSFAQQNDATDPQIAQQIRALTLKYEEALNEHDAKAAAAFFTEDAVWTTPQGTFYGRRAIERRLANYHFHRWHIKNEVITVDRVISVGDQVRAIGTWSNTVQEPDGSTEDFNGHFTSDLVIEGGTWKIRLNTYDQSRSY